MICKCGCGEITKTYNQNDFQLDNVKGEHKEFIRGHNNKRFYIDEMVYECDFTTDCLEWPGYIDIAGYGRIMVGKKSRRVHRLAYEMVVGNIPDGMHVDHKCRNTKCYNAYHLDIVTPAENNRRRSLSATEHKEL